MKIEPSSLKLVFPNGATSCQNAPMPPNRETPNSLTGRASLPWVLERRGWYASESSQVWSTIMSWTAGGGLESGFAAGFVAGEDLERALLTCGGTATSAQLESSGHGAAPPWLPSVGYWCRLAQAHY